MMAAWRMVVLSFFIVDRFVVVINRAMGFSTTPTYFAGRALDRLASIATRRLGPWAATPFIFFTFDDEQPPWGGPIHMQQYIFQAL
jgi:hypothetical protein